MYTCICTYIYNVQYHTCVYIYIYTHIHTLYIYIYVHLIFNIIHVHTHIADRGAGGRRPRQRVERASGDRGYVIYIYIYIYMCIYTHMYIYIYTHTHMYMYTYMCMCLYMYIYIYIYVLLQQIEASRPPLAGPASSFFVATHSGSGLMIVMIMVMKGMHARRKDVDYDECPRIRSRFIKGGCSGNKV